MPWYKAGTVSVAQNSNAVTGVATAFIANSRVGDAFLGPDGRWYEVTNIASDTAMAISPNYLGASINGGTYALAPMQGYYKNLADSFNNLNNQFGPKLAALGTTGNYDVLPVTKGGTGGTSEADARAKLGLGSAARAPLVGTVSQSGGVPTGSVFEANTNGNGSFVKHADGSMECRVRLDPGLVQPNGTISANWAFPAVFAEPPVISGMACTSGGYGYLMSMGGEGPASTTSFAISFVNRFSEARYAICYLTAKGRWF
jgi:hypothetical protein